LQEVHTLTNAEVMPARQVTNIAVQPGDLFQDANERSTVGHRLKYMEICLPFKVSHEKTQDIPEVDDHEHKHGDGGHKGIKSVILETGTSRFIRIRIGIGRPPHFQDPSSYVLANFNSEEKKMLKEVIEIAREAVLMIFSHGLSAAMNYNNRKR